MIKIDDFEAVIFDLDGTLIDSMGMWKEIDEEYLGGLRFLFDIEQLFHHRFVEMQSARGINEKHIVAVFLGMTDGVSCYFNGRNLVALGINRYPELIADYLQLGYRGGSVNIACGKKRIFALPLEKPRELSALCGFTRALQAHHHDDRRRLGGDFYL